MRAQLPLWLPALVPLLALLQPLTLSTRAAKKNAMASQKRAKRIAKQALAPHAPVHQQSITRVMPGNWFRLVHVLLWKYQVAKRVL